MRRHTTPRHPFRTITEWRQGMGPTDRVAAASAVALLIALITGLVFLTGGTSAPYLHAMYLPVLLAAYLFRVPGGLAAGVLGGLALGPAMPLSTVTFEMQITGSWLYRLGFLSAIGGVVGAIVTTLDTRNQHLTELTEALAATQAATLRSFTALVEVYDEPTGTHCERVARNACLLGHTLGLPTESLEQLYWAGILHDVGKISVPSEVIRKPGRLTEAEYELVKEHTRFGEELLRSISTSYETIAAGVGSHHERWDGSGYPRGLAGEQIPLFGRILAVVDVFEALTSDRPYRRALDPEDALGYLRENAGTQFDPELVERYARLYAEGAIWIEDKTDEPPTDPRASGTFIQGRSAADLPS